jgi:L-ascorbate metabolism protein UlaG (beta-lactamase superfamily)
VSPTGEEDTLRVTWIGHSTVLLELDGVRLLTDPVLRGRMVHLRRVAEPADAQAHVDLDAVLVSHLHYDHLDLPSLSRIGRGVRVVVPRGGSRLVRRRGFTDVVELGVDEETEVGAVTVSATEADHDSRRTPFPSSVAAVGYLVTGSARVYFAGDTDLFEEMHDLGGNLDLALLPVAGWGPRVPAGHLDPERAAQALRLLRPRVAIPIHWGTYRPIGLDRSDELLRGPAEEFARLAAELAPQVDVRVLPVGGTLELPTPLGAEAGA